MAEPATTPSPTRIELSVSEARIRFLQLVRLTRVTRQTTVIVEQGRPVAAIVSPEMLADDRAGDAAGTHVSAAGWMRRLEKVREGLRRQHATRTTELLQALDEAWKLLDTLRPSGTDKHVDTLRTTHAEIRRRG
jgi:PHD/YefM family antitoxin component YafN of YafNO toxin-antitoxin module